MKYKKAVIAALCMVCAGVCYSMNTGTAGQTVVFKEAPQDNQSEGASLDYDAKEDGTALPEEGAENKADANQNQEAGKNEGSGRENGGQEQENAPPPLCYVHICGEVMSPGVYQIEEGSRVFQVVEAAGGFTEKAAEEYLNLAGEIQDGMKIFVLSQEEARESGLKPGQELAFSQGNVSLENQGGEKKVNINTAAKEELMTLSGIGESKAEDIIRYREEHGPFQAIEDIKNVPGIKDAAFQKVKDNIMV